jgi:hypothetical protein
MREQTRREQQAKRIEMSLQEERDYTNAVIRDRNGNLMKVKLKNGKIIPE